jgi:hypothetical protein
VNFKDLCGGQSDTRNEQTIVIWTNNEMNLWEVGSAQQRTSEYIPSRVLSSFFSSHFFQRSKMA